jgi:hypothetical protein
MFSAIMYILDRCHRKGDTSTFLNWRRCVGHCIRYSVRAQYAHGLKYTFRFTYKLILLDYYFTNAIPKAMRLGLGIGLL